MATFAKLSWAAAIVLLAAAASGCYKPKVVDGGLLCAPGVDGGTCPDGFHCAADGTCKTGGAPQKCQASSPHLNPLCTADPGNDCDPVCQSRCECGRCGLKDDALICMPPGTKARGAICDPEADDCAPGNVCTWDCENKIGRCYRFCGKGGVKHANLCEGQDCDNPVYDSAGALTDLTVCPAPLGACDPVGNGSDCGNSALGCYVDGSGVATVCECKGKNQPNMGCSVFNSCVPGYRCVTIGMNPPTCLKTCRIGGTDGGTDCATGTCTSAGGTTFGYCSP